VKIEVNGPMSSSMQGTEKPKQGAFLSIFVGPDKFTNFDHVMFKWADGTPFFYHKAKRGKYLEQSFRNS
jgi:hypothetical protein